MLIIVFQEKYSLLQLHEITAVHYNKFRLAQSSDVLAMAKVSTIRFES